jgi:penicillin-binding protein 2
MLRERRLLALASALVLLFNATDARAARRRSRAKPSTRKSYRPPPPPALVVPVSASARDLAVGEACRRGLGSVRGSVVAMDPYSGRVITVLNPHLAIESAYQPCSVFKVVVAIAGLTEGVIDTESVYNCAGGCWAWPGHGPINLRRALAVSCNPYFQWVGQQLGYAKVQRYAQVLGLGAPSGINLDGEVPGRLPLFVGPAEVGHLSSHAKGVATSALQLGVLLSATINGGVVYQPQLSGAEGFVANERWRLPQGTVLGGLTEGFLSAVNEGSAATAFDPDISVAGKTGTCAGVGWFASYAPAERPEVVIVVFVRPGSGHLASTVAGRIYQDLYKPSLPASAAGGR